MQAGLVVETAEAREVHDIALLIGYGAAAVNPYLALDLVRDLVAASACPGRSTTRSRATSTRSRTGCCKVMSKMGISTVQSYRGAQIFEAVGLDRELVERHFTGTPSRLGGDRPGRARRRGDRAPRARVRGADHRRRRRRRAADRRPLPVAAARRAPQVEPGDDRGAAGRGPARRSRAVRRVRAAVRRRGPRRWSRCAGCSRSRSTRGAGAPVAASTRSSRSSEIVKRFVTGAMSFGSISAEAHETLAIAMNRIGARVELRRGRRGAAPVRARRATAISRRSAIKQVASGRFGVTTHYLVNADDLQIKIAQGAKPGEGGQLPGNKIDERIAKVRCSTPGVTLISPPPHHDIYSIEDLAQLIYDLSCVNPTARVSVKLVSEVRRRHDRGRRRQGAGRLRRDRRLRGRHRRGAAVEPQARRPAVGARAGRDPAGAGREPAARPRSGSRSTAGCARRAT